MKLQTIARIGLASVVFFGDYVCAHGQGQAWSQQILLGPVLATNAPNFLLRVAPVQRPFSFVPPVSRTNFLTGPVIKAAGSNSVVLWLPQRGSPVFPKPGVYTTEPYKSIVVVPEKHPDDRAIIAGIGGGAEMKMPMAQPELKFIPRAAPGK